MIYVYLYKGIRKGYLQISHYIHKVFTTIKLMGNGVQYKNFSTIGIPYIMVSLGGKLKIGHNFVMNNGITGNPIGCYNPCTLFVGPNAVLSIGNYVGISQTAIICHQEITIGNNVNIGGGTSIYDTDFHSLSPLIRNSQEDQKLKKNSPVRICDNVFIGAHCIILKGVTIGKNSIIGAGSIVTKSIPDNQIWAGNPAKFIKNIPL